MISNTLGRWIDQGRTDSEESYARPVRPPPPEPELGPGHPDTRGNRTDREHAEVTDTSESSASDVTQSRSRTTYTKADHDFSSPGIARR
jgi:hypothetical protein